MLICGTDHVISLFRQLDVLGSTAADDEDVHWIILRSCRRTSSSGLTKFMHKNSKNLSFSILLL